MVLDFFKPFWDPITRHIRRQPRRLWLHAVLIAVEILGIALIYSLSPTVVEIPVEKDRHWWTPLIPIIAAIIATVGALVTLRVNTRQSEKQFERRLSEDRKRFEKERADDEERSRIQEDATRVRFDRQALETLFTDIIDRFSSANPIIRASAAIRLAEMAQKEWPYSDATSRPQTDRAAFAFFVDAVSQLTAALHLDSEQPVRDEVLKALARVTDFAESRLDAEQELLNLLIAEEADANRSSRKAFVDVLAEYCSVVESVTHDDLRPLASLAPVIGTNYDLFSRTTSEELSVACLHDMASSTEGLHAIARHRARRQHVAAEARAQRDKILIDEIAVKAACMIDSRDALAASLYALRRRSNMPREGRPLRYWERVPELRLRECFLAGADLYRGTYPDTGIRAACLEGANLQGAYLQSAHLTGALLEGANLQGARLQRAMLSSAQLQEADLTNARLLGTRLGLLGMWRLRGAKVTVEQLREAAIPDWVLRTVTYDDEQRIQLQDTSNRTAETS